MIIICLEANIHNNHFVMLYYKRKSVSLLIFSRYYSSSGAEMHP